MLDLEKDHAQSWRCDDMTTGRVTCMVVPEPAEPIDGAFEALVNRCERSSLRQGLRRRQYWFVVRDENTPGNNSRRNLFPSMVVAK